MAAAKAFTLLNAVRGLSPSLAPRDNALAARADSLVWGTIGDSWASGVAYSDSGTYDDNAGNCLRISNAYTSLMDYYASNWLDVPSDVSFKACSGAVLFDMAKGQQQIQQTSKDGSVLLMSAGGNDAGFANVLVQCVYQPNPIASYDCQDAIDKASKYINGDIKTKETLRFDTLATYENLFNTTQAGHKPFSLYHLGYIHYWSVKDDSSWCNDIDFGISTHRPKLTLELRTKMNDLTDSVNKAINDAISAFKPKIQKNQKLSFLDISPSFENHRFCEGSMSPGKHPSAHCDGTPGQYYNPDVWTWNFQYSNAQENDCSNKNAPDITGMINHGNSSVSVLGDGSGDGSGSGSGPQTPADGWHLRPFHPKYGGHAAIANTVIAQLAKDGVKGVKKSLSANVIQTKSSNSTLLPRGAV